MPSELDAPVTRLVNPQRPPLFSDYPETVGLEITGRCQLACHHCFNLSSPTNPFELSLATIERLLDEMVEWSVKTIRLTGGEPTLHRDFRAIVEGCAVRGISVGMNTNGIHDTSLLDYLCNAPIDMFFVSLDGMEECNDAIRGTGTFRRALASCATLRQAGRRVMISYHAGRENQADLEPLAAQAAAIDVDLKVSPIRPIGRAIEEMPDSLLSPSEYHALVRRVVALRASYPEIRILTDFDILGEHRASDCAPDAMRESCKAGRTMININYAGEIYPCAFFATPDRRFSAGNVRDHDATTLWRTAETFRPFRTHQKSTTCQSCDHYQGACVGGCPAVAHFTSGALDAHDPTCFVDLTGTAGRGMSV